jgi:hypothetical protein
MGHTAIFFNTLPLSPMKIGERARHLFQRLSPGRSVPGFCLVPIIGVQTTAPSGRAGLHYGSQLVINDPAHQMFGYNPAHDLAPVNAGQFFLTDKLRRERAQK